MTADDRDPESSRPARGSGLGMLGMGIWLFGVIIGFVVVVEYDPDGADFRDAATRVTATVETVTDDSIEVALESGGSAIISLAARDEGRFEAGDTVTTWHIEGDDARLDEDVPLSPRRATDFIAPVILLLIGAVVISAGPEVLYSSRWTAA